MEWGTNAMHPSSRFHASAGWAFLALLAAILAALLTKPAKADRMFIIDTMATKINPTDIDWPTGPIGLTGRFHGAIKIAQVPGQPTLFIWDIICPPAMVTFIKNNIPANRFLGQKYSDLRILATTQPNLIKEFFRKQISRNVIVNGSSTTIQILVPQSDTTAGDTVIVNEVAPNRWFGISDGEN